MSHLPYPETEHSARLMCADPQALAYEWIKAYTANMNSHIGEDDGSELTVDELIETGMTHIDPEDKWGGDYIVRGGAFEGTGTDPTFWNHLSILKNINIPSEKRGNFFSCSC